MIRILHPTDFSPASDVAFVHALKLALTEAGSLTIFHYAHREDADDDTRGFPRVRDTLTQWGLLPPNSPREAVGDLGLHVRKIEVGGEGPIESVLGYLDKHPTDLIVLATHQRSGLVRWLYQEVAVPVAQRASLPALFVPPDVKGFVDAKTGAVRLRRIVIPVDRHPHPHRAIDLVPAMVEALHAGPVTVDLVHVGTAETMPRLDLPEIAGWTWNTNIVGGNVVDEIVNAVEDGPADLIVLATHGRRGFLDALRGSTTEQVVRNARVPVLAVPASLEPVP